MGEFKVIDSTEFDVVSVFVTQNATDKKDWSEFKNFAEEIKKAPFNFTRKEEIREKRRKLSDRMLNIPNLQQCDPVIYQLLKDREVLDLSYLNIMKGEEDVGIEYSFERGLIIRDNDSIII
jgi:hypothetical protein